MVMYLRPVSPSLLQNHSEVRPFHFPDRFWFEYIRLVGTVRFKLLAEFPADYIPTPQPSDVESHTLFVLISWIL